MCAFTCLLSAVHSCLRKELFPDLLYGGEAQLMAQASNDGLCKAKVHVCMMTLPIALPPPDQYHSSHLKIVLIGCELSMRH